MECKRNDWSTRKKCDKNFICGLCGEMCHKREKLVCADSYDALCKECTAECMNCDHVCCEDCLIGYLGYACMEDGDGASGNDSFPINIIYD